MKKIVEDIIMIMPTMHRKLFRKLRRHDMKKYTMALIGIHEDNGHEMSYYCKKFTISKPNFTKTINELLELGFVERRVDESDRRKTRIHITDAGKKEVEARKKFLYDCVEERLESLDKEDLHLLHEHVLGIHNILTKIEEKE